MTPPDTLPDVQAWLVSVITHVGSVEAALATPEAAAYVPPTAVAAVVRPGARLTAEEQVAVYHGMYLLRMAEALAVDYPALAALLGHRRFHAMVADYVAVHPSRSYTLNRLGDALPVYLAARARRPSEHALADLARVEHAITLSFDAQAEPPIDTGALAGAAPGGFASLRLRTQAGLHLVATRCDPGAALDAVHANERPRTPPRRHTYTVVFRNGDEVRRLTLSRHPFTVLSALAAGRPLAEAIAPVPARASSALGEWFETWVAAGFFTGVALAPNRA